MCFLFRSFLLSYFCIYFCMEKSLCDAHELRNLFSRCGKDDKRNSRSSKIMSAKRTIKTAVYYVMRRRSTICTTHVIHIETIRKCNKYLAAFKNCVYFLFVCLCFANVKATREKDERISASALVTGKNTFAAHLPRWILVREKATIKTASATHENYSSLLSYCGWDIECNYISYQLPCG